MLSKHNFQGRSQSSSFAPLAGKDLTEKRDEHCLDVGMHTVDTVDTVDAPIVIQDQAVDARCRIYGLLRALNRFIGTRSFSLNSCLFAT